MTSSLRMGEGGGKKLWTSKWLERGKLYGDYTDEGWGDQKDRKQSASPFIRNDWLLQLIKWRANWLINEAQFDNSWNSTQSFAVAEQILIKNAENERLTFIRKIIHEKSPFQKNVVTKNWIRIADCCCGSWSRLQIFCPEWESRCCRFESYLKLLKGFNYVKVY